MLLSLNQCSILDLMHGIDATGVEPRPDLIENATPKVIKNKPKM